LEVTDIDGPNKRVHIRDGKGGQHRHIHHGCQRCTSGLQSRSAGLQD
jgi:hypothetical protein